MEPRPVTPKGEDHLFWMLSITPEDYARVVATVFVDSKTNEVHGPFLTRETTFAWLRGEEVEPEGKVQIDVTDPAVVPQVIPTSICMDIEQLWTNHCSDQGTLGR